MIKYIDTNKIEIPEGFFNDLNVPKFFQWLNDLPTADVEEVRHAEQSEVERKIFDDIKEKLIFNTYGIATISDKTFCEIRKKYIGE